MLKIIAAARTRLVTLSSQKKKRCQTMSDTSLGWSIRTGRRSLRGGFAEGERQQFATDLGDHFVDHRLHHDPRFQLVAL